MDLKTRKLRLRSVKSFVQSQRNEGENWDSAKYSLIPKPEHFLLFSLAFYTKRY